MSERDPRRRWYRGVSPGPTGKLFGALAALGVVFPIIGATLVERQLGEAMTALLLGALLAVAVAGVATLFVRRRPVEAWTCASAILGLGLALYIVLSLAE